MARASLSGGRRDADAAHFAIDAIEAEFDPPCALGLPLQQHDEIVGELAQLNLDCLDGLNGRSELPLGAEIRGLKRGAIDERSRPLSASSRAIGRAPNRAVIGARASMRCRRCASSQPAPCP